MKLFNFERPTIVRVDIFEPGYCKTISIDERDVDTVIVGIKNILSKTNKAKVNPIDPNKISIQCYEHMGKTKGKYKRFTVYGLSVDETLEIITSNLD